MSLEANGVTYVRNGNSLARVTQILEHVLDEHGSLGDGALCSILASGMRDLLEMQRTNRDLNSIGAGKGNLRSRHDCVVE